MLYLTNAGTDKLQIITATGADCDVHVSWVDNNAGAFTPGRTNTAITTATTTDVCATPASSTNRAVKTIHCRNKDTTQQTVTVIYNQNGTQFELHEATLAPEDSLEYIEGIGFFTLSNTSKLDKMLFVSADVTNATTSFADITGLTWPILGGHKYIFNACLIHQTNATTTGAQFGVNGPAVTNLIAVGIGNITQSITAAAFGSSAAVTAVDTATVVETTGPGTANVIYIMQGAYEPSADGTFAVRSKSEVAVASGLIIKRGSWCHLREADS